MTTYEVLIDGVKLWTRSYTASIHGNAIGMSPNPKQETPLAKGDHITLLDYRPGSPGSDVVDLPFFRRDSDGVTGFSSHNGPWGSINPDVLRKVEA